MRFYRPLGRISALTFDLDDTIYDNGPVILRTEKELLRFIRNYHPALQNIKSTDFQKFRQKLLKIEPNIYHNVTEWRRSSIEQIMLSSGLSEHEAAIGSEEAMDNFANWRSRINIPQETHETLAALANRWPLAVITNGNAKPELFGISNYFQFVLHAGLHGRSKPFSDMYYLAAKKLNLVSNEILHVGDNLTSDIAGAIRCGMQACWLKPKNNNTIYTSNGRKLLLPHIEISRLSSLTMLI